MVETMSGLKPCPFCGPLPDSERITDATRILGTWNFIHRCPVIGPVKIELTTREDVLTAWNTRDDSEAREAFEAGARLSTDDDGLLYSFDEWKASRG